MNNPKDGNSSETLHPQSDTGESEHHKELEEINEENFTNYATQESYKRKTTFVDIYFASKIVKTLKLDPKLSPWQCFKRSDWVKWNEAIETKLHPLNKKKSIRSYRPNTS